VGTEISECEFGGWRGCARADNGHISLIVPRAVGPRIISLARPEGPNLFAIFKEELGGSGERVWRARGGHRLWVAPEDRVVSYTPDNEPISLDAVGGTLIGKQPRETTTGLVKSITVTLEPDAPQVTVTHRIMNDGSAPRRLAPWALTMIRPGAVAMAGFPPRGTFPEHLLPTHPLVLWAYTDLSDPRFTMTPQAIMLRCDPAISKPQKFGLFAEHTWGAALCGTDLFVKRYEASLGAAYPDFGCSFECFTNDRMLELETLGPLTELAPGQSIDHTEKWVVLPGISAEAFTAGVWHRAAGINNSPRPA